MKIVVIDDEPEVALTVSVCFNLRWPDATVFSAADGTSGLELVEKEKPDLVVLDLGLPDMDGLEVCRRIRDFSDMPIIILSAKGAEVDKVRGLELGADDYVTKPFSHIELIARVGAVLRRTQWPTSTSYEPVLVRGALQIDTAAHEVSYRGKVIKLTPIEFRLLYQLARNNGRVLSHSTLLTKVWGREYDDASDYLKVHIQHLRRKLEDDPENPKIVMTARGSGYKFVEPKA